MFHGDPLVLLPRTRSASKAILYFSKSQKLRVQLILVDCKKRLISFFFVPRFYSRVKLNVPANYSRLTVFSLTETLAQSLRLIVKVSPLCTSWLFQFSFHSAPLLFSHMIQVSPFRPIEAQRYRYM